MSKELKYLKNLLKEKKINPTYHRIKILQYLKRVKHPHIEEIYRNLSKEIPTISRVTIYNTLNLFLEKGVVLALRIPGEETRFDGNPSWHHHFICEKCGRIIDLDIECEYLKKGTVEGHIIKELYGYFKGICRDCLEKREKKEEKEDERN